MNPEYITFESMLPASTTYQFWVPEYQRAYVWESEHLHGLWRDLGDLYRDPNGGKAHFLGIVLQKVVSSAKNPTTKKELIDGQQRVTTILILLAAIRDHLAETASPPRKLKFSTDPLFFVRDSLDTTAATEFPVLQLQRADHAELERAAMGQWRKQFDRRKQWGKILRSYEYFRYCLWVGRSSFDEVQAFVLPNPKASEISKFSTPEEFWTHRRSQDKLPKAAGDIDGARLQSIVRSRLRFLCVTLDGNDEDPVVVFDSVNGKRMEFSQWDHSKTYFFRRIGDVDLSVYQQWESLEERIARFAKQSMGGRRSGAGLGEDLLYNFLIAEARADGERANKQRSAVQIRRLLLRLHKEREPSPAELAAFLRERLYVGAEAYLFLAGETNRFESASGKPLPKEILSQIKQIQAFSSGPPDPAMLAGLLAWRIEAIGDKALKDLMRAIEVFLARYFLSGRELSPLRSRFMQFLASANKHAGDEVQRIGVLRDELLKASASDGEIRQHHCVSRSAIYEAADAARIAAVFRGIERFRSGDASHPIPHGKGKDEFEVEHIFPQSCIPTPNKEWKADLSAWKRDGQVDEYSRRCHCLGNLAMLAGYANKAARNLGFERKKLALGKNDKAPGKKGKATTVLLKSSQDVLTLKEWTPEAIDSRTDALVKDALKYWKC
jgi:hypothetical protein